MEQINPFKSPVDHSVDLSINDLSDLSDLREHINILENDHCWADVGLAAIIFLLICISFSTGYGLGSCSLP